MSIVILLFDLYSVFMHLSISALGSLQVRLDAVPVTKFRFERVRALLVYLLVEGDLIHDRASIAFLLWPDLAQKTALENLRQAVAMLRRALQDRTRDVPFIETTSKTIQFNPRSEYEFDFTRFAQKLEQVKTHPHRSLASCTTCIEALEEAVSLYRGEFLSDIFIESERFEEWSQMVRARVHFQAVWALREVMTYHVRRRAYMRVIDLAQQLLRIDPLCEEGHHMMVMALAAQGHRHFAINHYESYATLLWDELGVKPPTRTVELYEQLMADLWRADLVDFVPFNNLPTTVYQTVGREAERKHVSNLLAHRSCRLVTLAGIGGSGKTHLALDVAWLEVPNFHDGTYFVNLTDVEPADRLAAIVRSLPIRVHPEANLKFQLLSWLREKEVLLVLDNYAHGGDDQLIGTILQVAPSVSVVVTAVLPLMIRGEHVVPVKGLSLCDNVADVAFGTCEAVELFLQMIRPLNPTYTLHSCEEKTAFISLCRFVGGLPIALEMLAYLALSYSLEEIAERVKRDASFLSSVHYQVPGRHVNLTAVFNDIWQKLTQAEQTAFFTIGQLGATFTVDDVTAVATVSPDLFCSLQMKSLIQPTCEKGLFGLRPFPPKKSTHIRYEIIPIFRDYLSQLAYGLQKMEPALVSTHH